MPTMSSITKFASAAIVGGVAIGALAAASVPRTPIEPAASDWGDRNRPAASAVGDPAPISYDNGPQMAPPADDRSGQQVAYEPVEPRDDGAADVNRSAPDAADEDAVVPQDDRAAQAADAAREAADDARAAESAPSRSRANEADTPFD